MSRSFRVEAIAQDLSAASLAETLTPKKGAKEVLDVWHSLQSEAVKAHPLLCRLAQLQDPPIPGKPHLPDIPVRESRGDVMAHQRPTPKGSPDSASESIAHDATDPQSYRRQCQTGPPQRRHLGIPSRPMINPLDSILFSRRPGRPEEGEQDITGTYGGVICFYLICLCQPPLSSPPSPLFSISFFLSTFFLFAFFTIK